MTCLRGCHYDVENKIFSFDKNLSDIIQKSDICITRAGASTLAELSFLNIPFVAVPLPNSRDNHQLENAIYYKNNDCCWIIDQGIFEEKIESLLDSIFSNKNSGNGKVVLIKRFCETYDEEDSRRSSNEIKIIHFHEDLSEKTFSLFKEIIQFINKITNNNEKIDLSKLKKALNYTTFEKLKEKEKTDGFSEAIPSKKDKNKKIPFFNLGPKNNWKNILDEKLQIKISNTFKGEFNELGYK